MNLLRIARECGLVEATIHYTNSRENSLHPNSLAAMAARQALQ